LETLAAREPKQLDCRNECLDRYSLEVFISLQLLDELNNHLRGKDPTESRGDFFGVGALPAESVSRR
jgi:hypothetical protein